MKKSNAIALKYQEYECVIPKSSVKFFNGYGVASVTFDIDGESILLIGVVDKNYKEVLPLTPANLVPRLFIALNGNFVVTAYNNETCGYQVLHMNRDGLVVNLDAFDFLGLDDEIVQLYYEQYSALYDTQSGEFLTPFYQYIGPFVYSEKYGCKVARATFYIEDENGNVINELSTVISISGKVLENYYDLVKGEQISSKDLPDALILERKKDKRKG